MKTAPRPSHNLFLLSSYPCFICVSSVADKYLNSEVLDRLQCFDDRHAEGAKGGRQGAEDSEEESGSASDEDS